MDMNRRQFLKMNRTDGPRLIPPPWALDGDAFYNNCTRCGDCVRLCPQDILVQLTEHKFPSVDFANGECTFCQDCVKACPTKALSGPKNQPWPIKATVNSTCLATRQVICTTCSEQCEAEAISFSPCIGRVAVPKIETQACTGCGACVAPCPAQAIEVTYEM